MANLSEKCIKSKVSDRTLLLEFAHLTITAKEKGEEKFPPQEQTVIYKLLQI